MGWLSLLREPGQAPGGKSHDALTPSAHDWGALEFLTLSVIPRGASSNWPFMVTFPLLGAGSCKHSCLSFCSGKLRLPAFAAWPSIRGGRVLCCVLPSLKDTRRVVDFPVCLAFYLMLGQSCDFQASYMWNWKLEAPYKF